METLLQPTPRVGGYQNNTMADKWNTSNTINRVETTSETLSGRGGLSLFIRYLKRIQVYLSLARLFGSIC